MRSPGTVPERMTHRHPGSTTPAEPPDAGPLRVRGAGRWRHWVVEEPSWALFATPSVVELSGGWLRCLDTSDPEASGTRTGVGRARAGARSGAGPHELDPRARVIEAYATAPLRVRVLSSRGDVALASLLLAYSSSGLSMVRRVRRTGATTALVPGVVCGTGPIDGLLDEAMDLVPQVPQGRSSQRFTGSLIDMLCGPPVPAPGSSGRRTPAASPVPGELPAPLLASLHIEVATPQTTGVGDWLCGVEGWARTAGTVERLTREPSDRAAIRAGVLRELVGALDSARWTPTATAGKRADE